MNALQMIALGLGMAGLAASLWSMSFPQQAQKFFSAFPRNETIGRVLMLIDVAWCMWLLDKMNLGSWNEKKTIAYAISPFLYLLIITQVNHYLGARSLALLLILAAKPVVWVCFLRAEPSSLVLTTLAYLWVVMGICFFAAPHWLRDCVNFWCASPSRWTWGCRLKMTFSAALICLGLFVY